MEQTYNRFPIRKRSQINHSSAWNSARKNRNNYSRYSWLTWKPNRNSNTYDFNKSITSFHSLKLSNKTMCRFRIPLQLSLVTSTQNQLQMLSHAFNPKDSKVRIISRIKHYLRRTKSEITIKSFSERLITFSTHPWLCDSSEHLDSLISQLSVRMDSRQKPSPVITSVFLLFSLLSEYINCKHIKIYTNMFKRTNESMKPLLTINLHFLFLTDKYIHTHVPNIYKSIHRIKCILRILILFSDRFE